MYFFPLSFFLSLILVINFHKNLHPHFCCFHQVFPQHRSVSRIISLAFSSRCSALFTMPLNICCLIEYWTCMTALQEFMENGTKNLLLCKNEIQATAFLHMHFSMNFLTTPVYWELQILSVHCWWLSHICWLTFYSLYLDLFRSCKPVSSCTASWQAKYMMMSPYYTLKQF